MRLFYVAKVGSMGANHNRAGKPETNGIQHKGHGPRIAGSVAVSERMRPIEKVLDGLETRT